jgi:DNA topoisomerase-1
VNGYLREASGEDVTAKDFRTWAGTALAAQALRELGGFESETEARRKVVAAIDQVARRLGHTRAVCRRSYVHPDVISLYMGERVPPKVARLVARLYRYGPPGRISRAA